MIRSAAPLSAGMQMPKLLVTGSRPGPATRTRGDEPAQMPLDGPLGVLQRLDRLQQQDELVPGRSGHQVVLAGGPDHPAGHLDQHPVPGGLAELVVDLLEAVQVGADHGEQAVPAPAAGQPLGQRLDQPAAVGQAGQRVVVEPGS